LEARLRKIWAERSKKSQNREAAFWGGSHSIGRGWREEMEVGSSECSQKKSRAGEGRAGKI